MAVTAIVAVAALLFSADLIARKRQPELAMTLFAFDDRAAMLAFDRRTFAVGKLPPAGQAAQLARNSLDDRPLDAVALRMLSQALAVDGKGDHSLQVARLAERVTRRDLATQIVLLEDAVRRGSVGGALVHYDRALRANPGSQQILFPVLAAAIDDKVIRSEFRPYLRAPSPWIDEFVDFAGNQLVRTAATADLLIENRDAAGPRVMGLVGRPLLTRLVEGKEYARAAGILAMMPGAGGTDMIVNAAWTPRSVDQAFGVMAWTPSDTPTVGASFADAAYAPKLSLFASPATEGVALSKLLMLAPGRYRLDQRTTVNARESGSALKWRLRCLVGATTTTPIWTSGDMLAAHTAAGPTISAGCGVQRLELVATGGQGGTGLDALVTEFRLVRL